MRRGETDSPVCTFEEGLTPGERESIEAELPSYEVEFSRGSKRATATPVVDPEQVQEFYASGRKKKKRWLLVLSLAMIVVGTIGVAWVILVGVLDDGGTGSAFNIFGAGFWVWGWLAATWVIVLVAGIALLAAWAVVRL